MDMSFVNIANTIHGLAMSALDRGDLAEGYHLLEMSISSALRTNTDGFPIGFKLVPPHLLPRPTASSEHVVVILSHSEATIFAWSEFVTKPLFTYERFPVIGDILAKTAWRLEPGQRYSCIVDFGDGHDVGDYPRLAFSSALPQALLVPDPYVYFNDDYADYRRYVAESALPWRQRHDSVFWRGGSGGPRLCAPDPAAPWNWACQQRLKLMAAVRDSRFRQRLNIALSHMRTIEEDYLRRALDEAGFLQPPVDKLTFLDYRYQLDIDGWSNSWSLLDKLISGACILKVASPFGFRQWFYDKLEPWKHYVPIAANLSDLDTAVAWTLDHENDCEEIALAAQTVAQTIHLGPDLAAACDDLLRIIEPA